MKRIWPTVFVIGIVGGMFLVFANEIYAQGTGLTISPLTFELTANPGDVLTNKLRVYNPTDSTIAVRMEAEDFTPVGETGQVIVESAEKETYSLTRWVKSTPETFALEPKEEKIVEFIIEVPANAEPGGHYGSVLASTAGVVGGNITGTAVAQKIGCLVLLSVSGEVKENLIIKEFSAPSFSKYGPMKFLIPSETQGIVHVRPRWFVTINDWRDKKRRIRDCFKIE